MSSGTPTPEEMRHACDGAKCHMLRQTRKSQSLSSLYSLSSQATGEAVHLLVQMLYFDPVSIAQCFVFISLPLTEWIYESMRGWRVSIPCLELSGSMDLCVQWGGGEYRYRAVNWVDLWISVYNEGAGIIDTVPSTEWIYGFLYNKGAWSIDTVPWTEWIYGS
jgi:hypothetical protein